ncbi:MAG TPA: glycosyltransferase family 4 protein [Gammaproteobacteria bacterium]|nr:glycosyltransferase family 4 protein [Gammaproteobacteria bacterium]
MATVIVMAGAVSWLLTGLLRRYALAKSLLDIPNARSSHSAPTPRGGGVAIVLTFLGALPWFAYAGWLAPRTVIGFAGAGVLVALIGFLDDHRHVAARWRLLVHFGAVTWGLYWLGGLPPLAIFGSALDTGWAGQLAAAVCLVWLLNLYNFMDGIDGIAGIEAITVCLGGVLIYWLTMPEAQVWAPGLLLAAAVAGFLIWNYPPAKIFMGDAGSGFLGLMLGLLAVQAAAMHSMLFWAWVILLGSFVVDATVTLLRRLVSGERVYEAHRSHAYQYASRKFASHKAVSLAYGLVNLLWLLPLAVGVATGRLDGLTGVLIAYLPLTGAAFYLKAGAGRLQDV